MANRDIVVVAGYFGRCPLGGYAWQILNYLIGLRELGFDPYFYEDTAYCADCFDPISATMNSGPEPGIAVMRDVLEQFGFRDRWVFWDAQRARYYGLSAEATNEMLWRARLTLTLAAVTRLPRRQRERKLFIDIDPGYTQLRLHQGDRALRGLLAEHDLHFSIGELIGTADCRIPTGGVHWQPTRQPVATALWQPLPLDDRAPFTTIGRWDESRRTVRFDGELYGWSKRQEWSKFLDLPSRTQARFIVAMDANKVEGDKQMLQDHGWAVMDPLAVSRDAEVYRQFIRQSRGEFTVAKDLNVRLRSGWFSDRSACYLAAGRPVITQATGFEAVLPTGSGLFAVHSLDDAADAVAAVQADPQRHSDAAREIAQQSFEATTVLAEMLNRV